MLESKCAYVIIYSRIKKGAESMIFNDVFKEQLVKVKQSGKTTVKKALLIIAAVIIGFLALLLGGAFLGPIVIVALVFGTSYLVKSMNLEYEYILTNNELDIDKIMNKERRKRCFTIDINEIDIMANINNDMYKAQLDRAEKTINVSSNEEGKDIYAIIFILDDILTKLIFEPNEEMRKAIYRQAPSKVHL